MELHLPYVSGMDKSYRILLAEDDVNFGSVLRDYLVLNGYDVVLCKDGMSALHEAVSTTFDLFVSDVMMPGKDGFTLAEEIKKIYPDVPFIFLTAKVLKQDVLKGYKVGADDYINKPFDSEIFLCKIKAIVNRKQNPEVKATETVFNFSCFRFDSTTRQLEVNGIVHKLSPKEAGLLQLLCASKNEVLERPRALKEVWKEDTYFTARSMDVYIARLRKYFKDCAQVEIENLHGLGYRFVYKEEQNRHSGS